MLLYEKRLPRFEAHKVDSASTELPGGLAAEHHLLIRSSGEFTFLQRGFAERSPMPHLKEIGLFKGECDPGYRVTPELPFLSSLHKKIHIPIRARQ